MAADFWNRVSNLGRRSTPLEADLRRITETDLIDAPPKDVLTAVSQSSHDPEDRAVIMRHLQECLSETCGNRWRRVHGGLVLLDQLLRCGAPALVQEISEGLHFDPVQRLTFLERFEYGDDRRVQNIVRQKAATLRGQLLTSLQQASEGGNGTSSAAYTAYATGFGSGGAAGTKSAAASAASYSSQGSGVIAASYDQKSYGSGVIAASYDQKSYGSDCGVPPHLANGSAEGPKRTMVVNGLVSAGHRDDTSSEESSGEGAAASRRSAGRKTAPTRAVNGIADGRRRDVLEDSTDSEEEDKRRSRRAPKSSAITQARPKAAAPPPPPVDLLDMSPELAAAPAAVVAAPAQSQNLLDM